MKGMSQHGDPSRIDLQWFGEGEGNPGQASGEGAEGAGTFVTNLAEKATGSGADPALQEGAQGDQSTGDQETDKGTKGQLVGWAAGLTGKLKSDEKIVSMLSKFKSMDDIVTAYSELEGKQGSMVTIPTDKSSPEEWAEYWKKLGVPSKPDEYKFEPDPKLKNFAEPEEKEFRQFLHDHHVPQADAADWLKLLQQGEAKALEEFQKRETLTTQATEASLKETWGKDYEANVALMIRGISAYAPEGFIEAAKRTGFGNTPECALLFASLGKLVREDSASRANGAHQGPAKSAADILYPERDRTTR
jgi:hypothetical protein